MVIAMEKYASAASWSVITLNSSYQKEQKVDQEQEGDGFDIAKFNKYKVAVIAALNKKSLMKSQIMLEHC